VGCRKLSVGVINTWIVSPDSAGKKVVAFLVEQMDKQYSARFLKQAIEHNRCRINGRTERFASFILGTGDRIALDLAGLESTKDPLIASLSKNRILFEDQDLLVYNKPSGMRCDAEEVKNLTGFELLHRLDRDTTGVLLLAKNEKAARSVLSQFKQHEVEKTYLAIVDGSLAGKSGVIDNALGKKKSYQGQAIWGEVDKSDGLPAYTRWRCIRSGKEASLVECLPKTGRTHQLRVHLAGLGYPILGDFQYGNRFRCAYRPERHLLHASEAVFLHPTTERRMLVQAPLPPDFLDAQRCLGL
jgi:RluA family pseudouridine synthase